MRTIEPPELSKDRRKEPNDNANPNELSAFLGLTDKLKFLGHCCLPLSALVASHLQRLTGGIRVSDLKAANAAFNDLRPPTVKILYRAPKEPLAAKHLTFSDASQGKQSFSKTIYISGILIQ